MGILRVVLVLTALGLAGCGSSPPTNFYVLSSIPMSKNAGAGTAPIGVGPITLPPYLDRAGMVTRKTATDLTVSDFHQWAGPLRENVAQVLCENVAILLGTDDVRPYPWDNHAITNVSVALTRFDAQDGVARLEARWSVNRLVDGTWTREMHRSALSAPAAAGDYSALAAGLSQTVEALSREIAAALRGE